LLSLSYSFAITVAARYASPTLILQDDAASNSALADSQLIVAIAAYGSTPRLAILLLSLS